jgi:hypothetical protein
MNSFLLVTHLQLAFCQLRERQYSPLPKAVIKSMEQALRFIFTSKTAAVITGNRRVTKAA